MSIDVVTVVYNEKTHDQAEALRPILAADPCIGNFIVIDNRIDNRGFAKACNLGALQARADILGFINPDAVVSGSLEAVERCFAGLPKTMVCGESFGKNREIIELWGLKNWVCGAAMFVRREWFERLDMFDCRFHWSFEETDFELRTENAGFDVTPVSLPITHQSPEDDTVEVIVYKTYWLNRGWALYKEKYGICF
jgi:GT2 family glycosyltransferase